MVNDSAKKVARRNTAVINRLTVALVVSLLIHMGLLAVFRHSATLVTSCVAAGHYLISLGIYGFLRFISRETRDESGRIVDGGEELSGTVVNVAFDILYVTLFAFTLSPVTLKAYLADLLILVSLVYGFWSVVIKPMMQLTDLQESMEQKKPKQQPAKPTRRIKY